MMKISVIGMDIAKRVIQLHTVCPETGEIGRFKLQRRETLDFLARREPSVVAMEACGSAHWWGREISKLGHEVRLLAPRSVRPFVLRKQDGCRRRACDLDCSAATRRPFRRGQDRDSTERSRPASTARSTAEIQDHANQRPARIALRIRGSSSRGLRGTVQGFAARSGDAGCAPSRCSDR